MSYEKSSYTKRFMFMIVSHYPIRRLEAEEIRDGLLAVSGRLDTMMYGAPVPCYITSFMQGRGRPSTVSYTHLDVYKRQSPDRSGYILLQKLLQLLYL